MAPASKPYRVKRWPLLAGVSAALLTGVGIVAAAAPRHHAGMTCNCPEGHCAEGVCTPNVYSYGYYQTHWRSWPKPMGAEEADADAGSLPTQVAPPAAQEDTDVPPRPTKKTDTSDAVKPTAGEHVVPPPTTDKPDPFKDDEDQSPDMTPERPERPAGAVGEEGGRMSSLIPPANDSVDAVEATLAAMVAEGATTESGDATADDETQASAGIDAGAADAGAPAVIHEAKVSRSPLRSPGRSAERLPLRSPSREPLRPTAVGSFRRNDAVVAGGNIAPEPGKGLRLVNAEVDPATAAHGAVADEAIAEETVVETAPEPKAEPNAEMAPVEEGSNPLRAGWGARRAGTKTSTPEVTTKFNPLRK